MKIGIIECGKTRAEWAEHGEFGSWFPPLLSLAGERFDYNVFNALDGDLPADPSCCDAWLLTGSPASAYEDEPWQLALTDFLKPLVGTVPIVGICYGHQHLHHMLGGKVEKVAEWGVGNHSYDVVKTPDWLPRDLAEDLAAHGRAGFDLIALHQDQVTELAPGSEVLACSDFCLAAVTTIGDKTLTFQPHPEMDPVFAAKVFEFERDRIGSEATDTALESLAGDRNADIAARWIMAFLRSHLSVEEEAQ